MAVVTYGAGALNMVNAVAASYAEKVPLVVISGAPGAAEQRSGYLLHHQAKTLDSQLAIFREITCDQVVLDDPARAPADLARVLANCLAQSRPVYIELPRDQVLAPCERVPRLPLPVTDPRALAACADAVLDQLRAAKAPLLLVGVEIRRHGIEDKVARLARLLGIPVATTFMGRGLLADSDCALLGTYLGVAGPAPLSHAVEHADALLMLGVIVSDTNFGVSGKQIDLRRSILACDGSVTMGYQVYPGVGLAALVDTLLEHGERLACAAPAAGAPCAIRTAWNATAAASPRWTWRAPSTTCWRAIPACRWRPTSATACLPRSTSPTPTWWRPATTPAWVTACRAGLGLQAGGATALARDPGGRRRLPDDGLGTGQLPALRLGSAGDRV
ncbi:hypothetical protein LP419_34805 [Massilia sp. H-1]|nr:hypothetical protein LP419_34805 [Massilia sp. H-1]